MKRVKNLRSSGFLVVGYAVVQQDAELMENTNFFEFFLMQLLRATGITKKFKKYLLLLEADMKISVVVNIPRKQRLQKTNLQFFGALSLLTNGLSSLEVYDHEEHVLFVRGKLISIRCMLYVG